MDGFSADPQPVSRLSDHVPTAEPPAPLPWYSWRRWGWNFLTFSIVAHVLFGLVAAYLIVATIQGKRKQDFQAPGAKGPNAPTRALEHKVNMARQQHSMSAPAAAKRVTTSGLSRVALPSLPAMPKMDAVVMPASMTGLGGSGLGLSSFGNGGGGGRDGGGGGLSLFGLRGGQGLVGTFYDLKQNRSRQPTHIDSHQFADEVSRFVQGGWNVGLLAKYFQGPQPLHAQQIFIPSIPAKEGPAAFGLEKEVQPSLWVVHYKGTVTPTASGVYHFVGGGDDILMVKFDGKLVFARNWDNPNLGIVKTNWRSQANYEYHYPHPELSIPNGFAKGDAIDVSAGTAYPMEVLIGEEAPPYCFMALLIEKDGDEYERDPATGNPLFPVFRLTTTPLPPARDGAVYPPHAAKPGPPWRVVSSGASSSLFQ